MNLGLGIWQGVHNGFQGKWLRWYDVLGDWVSTDYEARESAEATIETERSARRSAIPRLASLGLTTEQIAEAIGFSTSEIEQLLD